MNIVFKARHYQIFGTFVFLSFVQSITQFISPIVGLITYLTLISINIGWVLILGYGLSKRQKSLDSIQFKVFMWTGIQLIFVVILLRLLMETGVIEIVAGFSNMLNITVVIYLILSLSIIYTYPAKTLKQLEAKDEIDINDYFGDIFLLLFWPIGTWTIQPRINKLKEDSAT